MSAALSPAAAEELVRRQTTRCNFCHDPIVWGTKTDDKRVPLDAEPDEHGKVLLLADGTTLRATILTRAAQQAAYREQGHQLRTKHADSCKDATEWSPAAKYRKPATNRRGGHHA